MTGLGGFSRVFWNHLPAGWGGDGRFRAQSIKIVSRSAAAEHGADHGGSPKGLENGWVAAPPSRATNTPLEKLYDQVSEKGRVKFGA